MLYSISGDAQMRQIISIPRRRQRFFTEKMENMTPEDYQRIRDTLSGHFEDKEVDCSSFVPGSVWTDTPYEPIYWACDENIEDAGYLFGLILWQFMIDHEDSWAFTSAEDSFPDRNIKGKVYFRIDQPE
ncbi:MAG: hypothetical protein KJI72_04315 [Patescibacteria group bacterium]|nr:hypothetical protein [Patescibacteria group bacterium]